MLLYINLGISLNENKIGIKHSRIDMASKIKPPVPVKTFRNYTTNRIINSPKWNKVDSGCSTFANNKNKNSDLLFGKESSRRDLFRKLQNIVINRYGLKTKLSLYIKYRLEKSKIKTKLKLTKAKPAQKAKNIIKLVLRK